MDEAEIRARLDAPLDKFRFCVERGPEEYSTAWFADVRKSDIYVSSRTAGSAIKISLHGSGICHVKVKGKAGNVDTTQRWRRANTPGDGLAHVLSVEFPTHLIYKWSKFPRLKQSQQLVCAPAAPPGECVEFRFLYSGLGIEALEGAARAHGFPLVNIDLPNGENVAIVVRRAPFDMTRIPVGAFQATGSFPIEPGQKIEDAAMTWYTEPKDGEPLYATHCQGITIQRD
jgi:hypothetical protein